MFNTCIDLFKLHLTWMALLHVAPHAQAEKLLDCGGIKPVIIGLLVQSHVIIGLQVQLHVIIGLLV